MDHVPRYNAEDAMRLLIDGNLRYVNSEFDKKGISENRRHVTAAKGQHPYAAIVTCSDSRVVPEFIFSAGIGDLFTIRTAGNTISECSLGSIEYAIRHLGVRLVVVMGHTDCGAVTAAVNGVREEHIGPITDRICGCFRGGEDISEVCDLNITNGLRVIESILPDRHDVRYVGALYDVEKGTVIFRDDLDEDEKDTEVCSDIYEDCD